MGRPVLRPSRGNALKTDHILTPFLAERTDRRNATSHTRSRRRRLGYGLYQPFTGAGSGGRDGELTCLKQSGCRELVLEYLHGWT